MWPLVIGALMCRFSWPCSCELCAKVISRVLVSWSGSRTPCILVDAQKLHSPPAVWHEGCLTTAYAMEALRPVHDCMHCKQLYYDSVMFARCWCGWHSEGSAFEILHERRMHSDSWQVSCASSLGRFALCSLPVDKVSTSKLGCDDLKGFRVPADLFLREVCGIECERQYLQACDCVSPPQRGHPRALKPVDTLACELRACATTATNADAARFIFHRCQPCPHQEAGGREKPCADAGREELGWPMDFGVTVWASLAAAELASSNNTVPCEQQWGIMVHVAVRFIVPP